MTKTIEDYILVQKVIPKQLCCDLVEEIRQAEWQAHKWYNPGSLEIEKGHSNDLEMLFATEEQHERVHPYLMVALNNYQDRCGWVTSEYDREILMHRWLSGMSLIRFNRYREGTMMRKHYDHIKSIFEGETKGIPIVSIVGNLNEDYEGAKFVCRDQEIELSTGDVVLFPSNFMFPHEVTPAIRGTRYSFAAWAF